MPRLTGRVVPSNLHAPQRETICLVTLGVPTAPWMSMETLCVCSACYETAPGLRLRAVKPYSKQLAFSTGAGPQQAPTVVLFAARHVKHLAQQGQVYRPSSGASGGLQLSSAHHPLRTPRAHPQNKPQRSCSVCCHGDMLGTVLPAEAASVTFEGAWETVAALAGTNTGGHKLKAKASRTLKMYWSKHATREQTVPLQDRQGLSRAYGGAPLGRKRKLPNSHKTR